MKKYKLPKLKRVEEGKIFVESMNSLAETDGSEIPPDKRIVMYV
tara:strand:- start:517 stop:648 length:132 start_codon:yes stop_codon:yes gene_type:complete